MTEQELRAAVAEYDAEMARAMEYDSWIDDSDDPAVNEGCLYGITPYVHWRVTESEITRYSSDSTLARIVCNFDSVEQIPATMRAMDAAAKAFQESLGRDEK